MNTSPLVACSEPPEIPRPDLQNVTPAGRDKTPTPPKRSLHILCIDDDEQILEMMNDCLAHFEHRVRVASGGKHGVELFCTAILKSEPFDVVITDLRMPDADGYQVARMIKDASPHTPVIIMTGEGKSPAGAAGSASAVDAAIAKPPRMQELNALLLQIAG